MNDPIAEIVTLLQLSAARSKLVSGSGRWAVHRSEAGDPFYCVVLEGSCRLTVGARQLILEKGDFVLIPAAFDFQVTSVDPPTDESGLAYTELPGEMRHGDPEGSADVRMVVGYCAFASPDANLLVSLLPELVHVRDEPRFSILVGLVGEESRARRSAREFVLSRLLEILFIEALRSVGTSASPNLLRGLLDERLGFTLRRIHETPAEDWSVARLAQEAAMSRSAFFTRFNKTVGVAPMEYLLNWRMALAKDLLRNQDLTIAEIAQRVGYRSSSTFSVAFTRQVGRPPTTYAKEERSGRPVP